MNASRFAPLVAVFLPLLVAAADDAPQGDLGKFQGKWKTTIGPEKNFTLSILIKGKAVTASGSAPDGQGFEIKGEIKLDETAKPVKTVDWVKFTGPDGNEAPDNKGLYELVDADTIKICNGGPGKDRPTEFKDGDDGHPSVLVLKRDKD
ncbi:TIGR03067 domain-containing protein [Singulisphaera acidiphila]|uniref:TIGR03067 domain-containing protein n=1 Tax=Singulisphaera acidiphila (strain ATCC BAA-1392 / DSM 18658 / VKM B-2454 / MOB10) TaxID=886293 RepID=L0D896_SINAD|nr:TIGR03067 domain-containing protein [Singulisphaera acidiphila]AGA25090.1 hypothetical protein Sinac_0678 [Singulisphaera acidiphila DSM 18658]